MNMWKNIIINFSPEELKEVCAICYAGAKIGGKNEEAYDSAMKKLESAASKYTAKFLYKVFFGKETIYCESKESAENMVELLRKAGYNAHMNIWSWQTFIEK